MDSTCLYPRPSLHVPSTQSSLHFPLTSTQEVCRYVWKGWGYFKRNIIAYSRKVLEVMSQKKEDPDKRTGSREEIMNSLTRVIAAINAVKDLVPLEIGKTILSAASTILLAVKVNPWSIVGRRMAYIFHRIQ